MTRKKTDQQEKLMVFAQVLDLGTGPLLKVVQNEALLELEPVAFV